MKKIICLCLVVVGLSSFLAACDGDNGPPPPPPTTTTTIEGPPSPPPTSDYINLARVASLMGEFERYPITWQAWRDPEYVSVYCPSLCADGSDAIFPLTVYEMFDFAMDGKNLDRERNHLIHDLPIVNRRCPDMPAFCGRSNVRKTRVEALRAEIEIQIALAEELRELAQKDPIREVCPFDSIKGFCECRRFN